MNKIAIVSGGFDPLHGGHIRLLNAAKFYGNIIVLLNSDDWLIRKKGYYFMDWDERYTIMKDLKQVAHVLGFDDSDDTCLDGLKKVLKYNPEATQYYFLNGGNRNTTNTPEKLECQSLGIQTIFSLGGPKTHSGKTLLNRYFSYETKRRKEEIDNE